MTLALVPGVCLASAVQPVPIRFQIAGDGCTQRLQCPLINEYTLNILQSYT